jgi:hypothetical protein
MFNWLKNLFKSKERKQVDASVNNLYSANNKNRSPLDPDNNPWQS